jgi:aspartyl aminopeptidase
VDNLSGSYTCLEAFVQAETDRPAMLVLYNHEEIGSLTGEGAQSGALTGVVERLVRAQGGDAEDAAVAAARSLLVSNDVAHALHPSFAEKYDKDYSPLLNGGPVLKLSAAMKYATTAPTSVRFRRACESVGVPMQRSAFRSDARSGSTVGPVSWARTGIPTVDVGLGILAMHAIRETAGSRDVEMIIRALAALVEQE